MMIPFSGPIVTRDEARAAGLKRFFTGLPCGREHIAERHTSSGECVACRKAQKERDYAKHRDRYLAKCRGWYEKNKAHVKTYESTRRKHINEVRAIRANRDRAKINALGREWARKNPDKVKATSQRAYLTRRAKIRKQQADYYERNPQPFKERAREWRRNNPEKISASRHLRRARLRGAVGKHTADDIENLYKAQHGKCAVCFRKLHAKYHVDHIVALARGGSNDIVNIQLTCAKCNTKKGAKDPIAFARKLGRLL